MVYLRYIYMSNTGGLKMYSVTFLYGLYAIISRILVIEAIDIDADVADYNRGPFDWHGRDVIDDIKEQMENVNADNCHQKSAQELKLSMDTLPDMPSFDTLVSGASDPSTGPSDPSWSSLTHVHNMAMNRAFFFSYIFQKLHDTYHFNSQPGLLYYHFSAAADVFANDGFVLGSGVFFDNNCLYPNWDYNLPFNHTLPLFGPRAWRSADDKHTADQVDYGVGQNSNYTKQAYKINDWYDLWLPDGWDKQGLDFMRKLSYGVGIKYTDSLGRFTEDEFAEMSFVGPSFLKDPPVTWTPPYYDCGRSNKWIVSAVSPVVDRLPRYLPWEHIRRDRFVATVTVDADYRAIDINQCPQKDNSRLRYYDFKGTALCKNTTTCVPLRGWGFRRGGYQCVCKPGYRYPVYQDGHFQGIDMETATEEQYNNNFDCFPVTDNETDIVINDDGEEILVLKETEPETRKRRWSPRYKRDVTRDLTKKPYDSTSSQRMDEIMEKKENVTMYNCQSLRADQLELPGSVIFGAETQFSSQARAALRLAHFLSNFLQNVDDTNNDYGNIKGDSPLNIDLIFGEVLSNVMGLLKIKGSGVFYDSDKFRGPDGAIRHRFGPYAYRPPVLGPKYMTIDMAGLQEDYLNKPWFSNVKERWQSNTYGLAKFTQKTLIRSDLLGNSALKRFNVYPMYYRAPNETDGWWSAPYFDCDGYVNDWIITYSVPFFGLNSIGSAIEFKGVVTVDVGLDDLELNQCPVEHYEANAFGNTAHCHYETTKCVHMPLSTRGSKFRRGGYRCECLKGHEYLFENDTWYFDGEMMEREYNSKSEGLDNKYDTLQCRFISFRPEVAGAVKLNAITSFILAATFAIYSLK